MNSSRTKVIVALGLALTAFLLTACQTMEGAGKDIERAGEKIQENAEKNN